MRDTVDRQYNPVALPAPVPADTGIPAGIVLRKSSRFVNSLGLAFSAQPLRCLAVVIRLVTAVKRSPHYYPSASAPVSSSIGSIATIADTSSCSL